MAKILDNTDFRKDRVIAALVNLPKDQQIEIENFIYEQKESLDTKIVDNLKLLTSNEYIKALEIKDSMKSKYNSTLTSKNKKLGLTELAQKYNVSIISLINIVNIKLISLGEEIISFKDMEKDFFNYINNTSASEIISALNIDQKYLIKEVCILDDNLFTTKLPTENGRCCPHKEAYRLHGLTSIASQITTEYYLQSSKE